MRIAGRTGLVAATALALVLTACGAEEADDGAQARVDQLEQRVDELEDARDAAEQEAQELALENEQLEAELAALGEEDAPEPEEPPARDEPAPLRSEEGLTEQLRLLFDQQAPDEFEPGTTEWTDAELPDGVEGAYSTAGQLAVALVDAEHAAGLGPELWEATVRVLPDADDPDLASIAVLAWGLADDATIGTDLRVTVIRTDDGWVAQDAERRHHCMRGVSDGLCV